jgi:hypothetical protein
MQPQAVFDSPDFTARQDSGVSNRPNGGSLLVPRPVAGFAVNGKATPVVLSRLKSEYSEDP